MYQPGSELKNVTIKSYQELSFRDVVYWKRFKKEHDEFCKILEAANIKIIYLNELLSQRELSIVNPNLTYMRDTCVVTKAGFIQMRMKHLVRTGEPLLVSKTLQKLQIPKLFEVKSPDILEGGDFVFPDDQTVMIGYGTRTTENGAIQAANTMLENDLVNKAILVPLPSWRVHLDGGLMFVDNDLFIYHPDSVTTFPSRILRKNEPMELAPLMDFLDENYKADKIPINDNELYLFGANVVCLDRRKCIIYEWNERIISELKDYSVDVLPIQGSELSRGGGGPHCMTLPLYRKK